MRLDLHVALTHAIELSQTQDICTHSRGFAMLSTGFAVLPKARLSQPQGSSEQLYREATSRKPVSMAAGQQG